MKIANIDNHFFQLYSRCEELFTLLRILIFFYWSIKLFVEDKRNSDVVFRLHTQNNKKICENFKYAEMSKRISSYEEKTLLKKYLKKWRGMSWKEITKSKFKKLSLKMIWNGCSWCSLDTFFLSLLSLLSVYIVIAQFMTCLA